MYREVWARYLTMDVKAHAWTGSARASTANFSLGPLKRAGGRLLEGREGALGLAAVGYRVWPPLFEPRASLRRASRALGRRPWDESHALWTPCCQRLLGWLRVIVPLAAVEW